MYPIGVTYNDINEKKLNECYIFLKYFVDFVYSNQRGKKDFSSGLFFTITESWLSNHKYNMRINFNLHQLFQISKRYSKVYTDSEIITILEGTLLGNCTLYVGNLLQGIFLKKDFNNGYKLCLNSSTHFKQIFFNNNSFQIFYAKDFNHPLGSPYPNNYFKSFVW